MPQIKKIFQMVAQANIKTKKDKKIYHSSIHHDGIGMKLQRAFLLPALLWHLYGMVLKANFQKPLGGIQTMDSLQMFEFYVSHF